jgi:hypothetical protein
MLISTRLHGVIDYAAAALLGSLSQARALPSPVRAALGTASAYHTSYAMVTDYEAGFRPVLTMRQHLALDAAGAAALCGAGLLMRRQPPGARALLIGAGLAELAVVALSSAQPSSGPRQGFKAASPDQVGYPPLDTPKPVAEGVHVVDSEMQTGIGLVLPVRMTVIQLRDGSLLLHSPTRFTESLRREVEALGRVRHLVAPNVAHWVYLKAWQEAFPTATTWAAPGLRERSQVRKSGVRLDHDLGDTAPAAWGDEIETVVVPGGLGFREVALFHRTTRTLLLTDLVLNLEERSLPAPLRLLARLFGMTTPDGMPPPYLRAIIKLRRQAAEEAASRLLTLRPERVVFAHGRWFQENGTAALRRSLRWLVD